MMIYRPETVGAQVAPCATAGGISTVGTATRSLQCLYVFASDESCRD
jgi:hypothetical protein